MDGCFTSGENTRAYCNSKRALQVPYCLAHPKQHLREVDQSKKLLTKRKKNIYLPPIKLQWIERNETIGIFFIIFFLFKIPQYLFCPRNIRMKESMYSLDHGKHLYENLNGLLQENITDDNKFNIDPNLADKRLK